MKKSWGVCVLAALLLAGCPKDKPKSPGDGAAGGSGDTAALKAPLMPVGMVDPFARLTDASSKSLQAGYKALRSKKYDDAQTAFRALTNAAPDYTPGGWALVRSLALGGAFKDVPSAFEGLIARDYVAYATKLDTAKEFTALRNAPEWAKIDELKTRYRDAYAKGLDKGFFFVARTRAASDVKVNDTTKDAALDLKQEVFHYDPDGKRFRRLTETDGHAFAINTSPDGKTLVFLVATKLHRKDGGVDVFVDPRVGAVELATLTAIGPFPENGQYDQVVLSTNGSGAPIFMFVTSTGAAKTYGFDTARTGLAELTGEATIPQAGETRVWPGQVLHMTGRVVAGVKMTDGANSFVIETGNITVTAARALAQASLDWSPGKSRLTYAGKLDACKILKSGAAGEKNELYVYDLGKKSAQRIASAVSAFETLWLDDDRLVYEGGVGKDGKLHLYAFVAHADSTLPTRNGAGLYGVPSLSCEQAEAAGDTEINDEGDPEGD
jgi:hypothetical protein